MTPDERLDHSPMIRGKYSAKSVLPKTPSEVSEFDPEYLIWAFETWDINPCSRLLYNACRDELVAQKKGRWRQL